jgi:hypothetical protein
MLRATAITMLFAMGTALPAQADAPLPPDLMRDGAPLDAMCFQFWEDDTTVDLTECTTPLDVTPLEHEDPAESGWHGYSYRPDDMPEEAAMRGWVVWKYLGETPRGYVVETIHNGGGTGYFSSVQTVRREGDRLHLVETHLGGDRCNGGVAAASVANGAVAGAVHITPYDLLALALGETVPYRAYDDISACAICCVGTATLIDDSLAWVTMASEPRAFAPDDTPDSPQACLDRLIAEGQPIMSTAELAAFGRTFMDQCGPDAIQGR